MCRILCTLFLIATFGTAGVLASEWVLIGSDSTRVLELARPWPNSVPRFGTGSF